MQDSSSLYPQTQLPQFPEQEHLKCPRCDSANTKFCYYNNYNLSQPRHFCRACKRYWTKGGALRKVPVGGGSRKSSKRGSSSDAPSAAAKRPASVLASGDKSGDEINNNRELAETLPPPEQNFGNFKDLSSNRGELGSFLDGLGPIESSFGDSGSGLNVDPQLELESGDGFLNIQGGGGGGDSGCWGGGGGNGWTDLSMYTPGPTFP